MPSRASIRSLSQILHRCIQEQRRRRGRRKKKESSDGFRLSSYMRRDGSGNHKSIRNHLAAMLADAQTVFDEKFAHAVEPGSCVDDLVRGLIEAPEYRLASVVYERLKTVHSLHASDYTFVSLLKACADSRDEGKGCHIHGMVQKNGCLQRNLFVGNALVNMYAKCGTIHKARDVFDGFLFRDVVSFTTLMVGLIDHECSVEALNCAERMRSEGIVPNIVTFACSLKACRDTGAIDKGQQLHAALYAEAVAQREIVIGNALVDMYGKCGFITKAQEVFDEMSVRDVVSWTALIAGYVTGEDGDKALACFDQMQLEGVSPNGATFACSLKACGIVEAKDKGIEIHGKIIEKGILHKDIAVGNALMDMYAKCGMLIKAHDIFDEFLVRDVVAWTIAIASYSDNGFGEKALLGFETMQVEGISPNAHTYVCILKACADIQALNTGREMHNQIVLKGLSTASIIRSALVGFYSDCGSFIDAREVFENHADRNVSVWNSMISGYLKHGQAIQALDCFHEWRNSKGPSPNAITFASALKACGMIRDASKGRELHAEMARTGLLEKRGGQIGNSLLGMYANCGEIARAQEILNDLLVADVGSWKLLIAGCARHAYAEKALDCFDRMHLTGVPPDAATLAWSLRACGILGAIDRGKEIETEITSKGLLLLEGDSFVGNAVVEMYAKCGCLRKAQSVFDGLLHQDAACWNSLVAEYSRWGYGDEALACLRQMRSHGVAPNAAALACSLKACGAMGDVEEGEKLHGDLIGEGGLFEPEDPAVANALVYMYAQCGALAKARGALEGLPIPDVYSWTALIAGYVGHRRYDEALGCCDRMRSNGVFPNASTFSCLLEACGCMGMARKGREMHAEIRDRGLLEGPAADVALGNSLVDMYAKCGQLAQAQAAFDKLSARDAITWTALIGGYSRHGHGKEAVDRYEQMLAEGFHPDAAALVCALGACGLVGASMKGSRIHGEVCRRGLSSEIGVGNALIGLYARCGALAMAQEVFEGLAISSNTASWNLLISGYARAGEKEMALAQFDRMQSANRRANAATFIHLLRQAMATAVQTPMEEARKLSIGMQEKMALMDRCRIWGGHVELAKPESPTKMHPGGQQQWLVSEHNMTRADRVLAPMYIQPSVVVETPTSFDDLAGLFRVFGTMSLVIMPIKLIPLLTSPINRSTHWTEFGQSVRSAEKWPTFIG